MGSWNDRLKKAREKNKMTQEMVLSKFPKREVITKQSLIKYEKGETFPKINVLRRLCIIYGVSADYIIFGETKDFVPSVPTADTLLALYMMLYSNKAIGDDDGNIKITDEELKKKFRLVKSTMGYFDFSSLKQLETFVDGLNRIAEEG